MYKDFFLFDHVFGCNIAKSANDLPVEAWNHNILLELAQHGFERAESVS